MLLLHNKNHGRFFIVGDGGAAYYSDTGEPGSWIDAQIPTTSQLKAVTYGSGTFLVAGVNGEIWTSPEGLPGSWTRRNAGTSNEIRSAIHVHHSFVVAGVNGSVFLADASNLDQWTDASFETVGNQWSGLAYGLDRFLIVGSGCRTWYSLNGAPGSWVDVTFGCGSNQFDALYSGSHFLAVGINGVRYSIDASSPSSWIPISPIGVSTMLGVAQGNGIFLITGLNNEIWSSSNAKSTDWIKQTTGAGNIEDAAYGIDRFIAVGHSGAPILQSSTDGKAWTDISTGITTTGLRDVFFAEIPYGPLREPYF